MTYTFRRKLMYTNKSPRRIDRKAGARNKKIIKPLYSSPCYLGEIENITGKPVITSNQAQVWSCLRKAGIKDTIQGFGQIFNCAGDSLRN